MKFEAASATHHRVIPGNSPIVRRDRQGTDLARAAQLRLGCKTQTEIRSEFRKTMTRAETQSDTQQSPRRLIGSRQTEKSEIDHRQSNALEILENDDGLHREERREH